MGLSGREPSLEVKLAEHVDKSSPRSQRTNDRAFSLWRELRGSRAYPTPNEVASGADTSAEEAGTLWPNVFVVYFNGQPLDSVFTFGSPVLESVLGVETGGCRVADCLPGPLRDSMLSFVKTLSKTRKPIAVSSSFAVEDGSEVLYRSIYLPLSADQNNVEHLLGAFSYKQSPAA